MARKVSAQVAKSKTCTGGRSFGCHHEAHERSEKEYFCRRCKAYMGCVMCAMRQTELVCLNCHDWATAEGEREHGKMATPDKVQGFVRAALEGRVLS